MSINMVELFSRIIFISLEVPFAKIQPGLTSSITSNPSTRSYPFAQDWYSIRCSQGARSQYWPSVICPLPDMHSFYVYSSQISSPSYMTHFTSHHSQKSPLLCLLDHVSLSGFAFGSLGLNSGGVPRVINEVCMCVRADLYLPHVQEQETSCLLFCLSLILFRFCLSQEACSLPKHKNTFLTLCLMFLVHLKEPELQMPISWWKKKGFLGLFHPAISKRK